LSSLHPGVSGQDYEEGQATLGPIIQSIQSQGGNDGRSQENVILEVILEIEDRSQEKPKVILEVEDQGT